MVDERLEKNSNEEMDFDLRDLTYNYYLRNKAPNNLPNEYLGRRVLEVGCGRYSYVRNFSCDNYVALDKYNSKFFGNYKFVRGEINFLPFKDENFDYFIARSILEHVEDPLSSLKELRRVAKLGGLVTVPTLDLFPFIYDPINWVLIKLSRPTVNFGIAGYGHLYMDTKDGWEKLFRESGFIVEKTIALDEHDIFSALEFFLLSIFFSRKEYVELMEYLPNDKFKKGGMSLKLFLLLKNVLFQLYRILSFLNIKVGKLGYLFFLKKQT